MGLVIALLILVAVWLLPIYVAHRIGAPKGRKGWLWGLLLGWVGVVIVAVLEPAGAQRAAV